MKPLAVVLFLMTAILAAEEAGATLLTTSETYEIGFTLFNEGETYSAGYGPPIISGFGESIIYPTFGYVLFEETETGHWWAQFELVLLGPEYGVEVLEGTLEGTFDLTWSVDVPGAEPWQYTVRGEGTMSGTEWTYMGHGFDMRLLEGPIVMDSDYDRDLADGTWITTAEFRPHVVPEPGSILLLSLGASGFFLKRLHRSRYQR